ncbi:MAG: GNAT family N-acetyltransferase [Acidobacteriaceae bacterium]
MELELLQSRDAVARLSPAIASLAHSTIRDPDVTYTPDYFLPRVGSSRVPRVVACYESGKLMGVLYAEELRICGIHTGWAFGGDYMGRGLVLAAPEREAEVVAIATEHLLSNGIHALRLTWRASGHETMPVVTIQQSKVQVWCKSEHKEEGDWLRLAPSYEEFLTRLGSHTRRNLRYYRRKAEAQGYTYVPSLSTEEYHAAIARLNGVADYPTDPQRDERDERFFEHFSHRILAGLRGPDGHFVSIIGAVRSGEHLHVLTQLNDESLRKLSISLVLRGYLIEDLIRDGFTSIHFVNGTSRMLGRFCEPLLLRTLAIDRTGSVAHPVKQLCSRYARYLRRKSRRVPVRLLFLIGSYMVS